MFNTGVYSVTQQRASSAMKAYNCAEAKRMHLERAKMVRERKESMTRQQRIFANHRWEDFRKRRLVAMDNYIAAKTKQRRAENYIK